MTGFVNNNRCFACGKENPIGLKLDFKLEHGQYKAEFIPQPEHQGYKGIVHGGIVATVLDEAMGKLMFELNKNAVTGSFSVRLNRPTLTGKTYTAIGEIVEEQERKILTKSRLVDDAGVVVAEAEGVMVKVKEH
ncbi:PaaI family thioesterase [Candidatus Woesearchaeota archaeon]|nr:PaaI family thioesterase [Candidatus Woesearchaeota archaeon]